jgi:hypothetical protein
MDSARLLPLTISVAALLTACVSTSRPLEVGPNTYSITSTADGFRTAAAARQSAFERGRKQCEAVGRKFLLSSESSERTRMGIDTTITVVYRCLDPQDPEYHTQLPASQ